MIILLIYKKRKTLHNNTKNLILMIIVADSGSTKTDWRLIDNDNQIAFSTIGLNPMFVNSNNVVAELQENFTEDISKVEKVFFYGSGCSSEERCNTIKTGLSAFFTNSEINVYHDMLGAAHALYGNEEGIVGILGTGSNTCMYNGKEITENIGGFGFILGDEGSGAFLGLKLIKHYLNNELPQNILNSFDKKYNLIKNDIINAVYNGNKPNRFLASFSKFLNENKEDKFISDLLISSFYEFLSKHILKYDNYKDYEIRLTGSVASIYEKELKIAATKLDIKISKIVTFPIDSLCEYHLRG